MSRPGSGGANALRVEPVSVGRRVDVDEARAPVVVPGRIYNELCASALETLPEECCGLILGDPHERYAQLVRCRNESTRRHLDDPERHPLDGRSAYWMSEVDYLRAREQVKETGQEVTAVYHSHVDEGAYLSELDLQYAENSFFPFPQADQIVVAVSDRRITGVALFRREGVGRPFHGRALVSVGP